MAFSPFGSAEIGRHCCADGLFIEAKELLKIDGLVFKEVAEAMRHSMLVFAVPNVF